MVSMKSVNRREVLRLAAAVTTSVVLLEPTKTLASEGQSRTAIQNRPQHAKERFMKSMNCSQAILETYAGEMGMSIENARKVSAAFAGGMGMGSECGALTGAFMVIGMKHGKIADKDSGADKETFTRVAMLVEEFKKEHGEILCSKLLGTDMGTPEGVQKAADLGLFTTFCPKFVETASIILDRILA
jgi:C_GCAxxG_C_C family probable redox protein